MLREYHAPVVKEITLPSYEIDPTVLTTKQLGELLQKIIEETKKRKEENEQRKCESDDPDSMCPHCNCWKHTRHMCS